MRSEQFTHRQLKLLRFFLENVRQPYAGADLMAETGIPSGNLYPLLIKFERDGLLESRREDGDPQKLGRPLRRFYSLTGQGVRIAQDALRAVSVPAHVLEPNWGRS